MRLYLFILLLTGFQSSLLSAQNQKESAAVNEEPKAKFALFDGTIVTGYVDDGAFLNFTGPNLSWTQNNSRLMIGMLPSLRIKEDHGTTKNSVVTPTLGAGLTYSHKMIAIQLPLYYNAKTSTANGEWNIGIGVGIRLKNK